MSTLLGNLLQWIGAIPPAVAAVTGALIAMSALSQDARLRRRVETLRTEIEAATRAHDRAVL